MFIKCFKEEFISLFTTNKMNLILMFVMPLLVVVLIGVEFSKGVISDIPIAVINHDNSAFSNQLIEAFDQNETFNVAYYPDNEQELEKLIKNSNVYAGMIIPDNFYDDVATLKSPTVLMIYDGSNMSLTSAAKAKATEILLTYKAGATISQLTNRLSITYEQSYRIAQIFKFNNRIMYNPSKSFRDFLSPMLISGYIQSAIALTTSVCIGEDIFKKTKKKRLEHILSKVVFYTLCGSLSLISCIMLQVYLFGVTFRGNFMNALLLSIGLSFSVSSFCVLLSSLIKDKSIALTGSAVLFIPNSIMAGTTWPMMSMPSGYQSFADNLPFTHYANNIRDIYLKGASIQHMMDDVSYMFAFGATAVIIAALVMLIAEKETDNKEEDVGDFHRDVQKGI